MQEKNNIGTLFDRIAGRYDLLNHLLSLNIDKRWRRKAVRMLAETETKAEGKTEATTKAKATTNAKENAKAEQLRVLDVAIGTGDLAIEITRQLPQAQVQGVDLSEEMMLIGKQKVRKAGLQERIGFMQASALELPFADGSFDIVTCAYGVRNFSDLDRGLQEMQRVLREGGRMMILEFSYPSNRFIAWVYDLYFSHVLPWVGRMLSKDKTAYSYLNKSVKGFVWGEKMCERLRQAGLRQVEHKPLTFGITTIYTATK